MHSSLPLSPLHSGLLVYDLAVTAVWNLLRNAETEDTHSTLRIWHSMLRELSPDMALQQASKEGSSQRPLFLSLGWLVLLPKSSVVFLTQGGRQLTLATRSFAEAAQGIGHQLHKEPAPWELKCLEVCSAQTAQASVFLGTRAVLLKEECREMYFSITSEAFWHLARFLESLTCCHFHTLFC